MISQVCFNWINRRLGAEFAIFNNKLSYQAQKRIFHELFQEYHKQITYAPSIDNIYEFRVEHLVPNLQMNWLMLNFYGAKVTMNYANRDYSLDKSIIEALVGFINDASVASSNLNSSQLLTLVNAMKVTGKSKIDH